MKNIIEVSKVIPVITYNTKYNKEVFIHNPYILLVEYLYLIYIKRIQIVNFFNFFLG